MKIPTTKANALKEQGEGLNQKPLKDTNSNSLAAQRIRLLNWLKEYGSATTIELRKHCDIMMPASRVHELRHRFGFNITTLKVYQPTDSGKLHRVAKYVMNGEVTA